MSWILHDPDEWEIVVEHKNYGTMFGHQIGSSGYSQRRRSPEEVVKIKAKRQREHEDAVLEEADFIVARRRRGGSASATLEEVALKYDLYSRR